MIVSKIFQVNLSEFSLVQEKLHRSDVQLFREDCICQHHEDLPKTPQTSRHESIEGFTEGPQLSSHDTTVSRTADVNFSNLEKKYKQKKNDLKKNISKN